MTLARSKNGRVHAFADAAASRPTRSAEVRLCFRLLGLSLAGLMGLIGSGASGGPVSSANDGDVLQPAMGISGSVGRDGRVLDPQRRQAPGLTLERSPMLDASTGDKNLDLLLEVSGKEGTVDFLDVGQRASSVLSARALARIRGRAAVDRSGRAIASTPNPQPRSELLGDPSLDLNDRGQARSPPKVGQDWSGGLGGGSSFGGESSGVGFSAGPALGGYTDVGQDRRAGVEADDSVLRSWPREVIAFLRRYRFVLIGSAVIGLLLAWALSLIRPSD